jgi:hypothetical protein
VAAIRELRKELAASADPDRARNLAWFFKTAKGQYGYGDRFIGISVPVQRQIARRYRHLALDEIAKLLSSRTHEHPVSRPSKFLWINLKPETRIHEERSTSKQLGLGGYVRSLHG